MIKQKYGTNHITNKLHRNTLKLVHLPMNSSVIFVEKRKTFDKKSTIGLGHYMKNEDSCHLLDTSETRKSR
jgi:hypothetical protein